MTPRELHCVIALSVTSSGTNCIQAHHFRCRQIRAPRLSRHMSRGVNCHPQHASVTCPLSARASTLYPFENYCLQISAHCAPWDGQEFRQIVYLSALRPGIRGTLSLAAGSPFARLRAERYLLRQNQYFEYLIWIRRTAGS